MEHYPLVFFFSHSLQFKLFPHYLVMASTIENNTNAKQQQENPVLAVTGNPTPIATSTTNSEKQVTSAIAVKNSLAADENKPDGNKETSAKVKKTKRDNKKQEETPKGTTTIENKTPEGEKTTDAVNPLQSELLDPNPNSSYEEKSDNPYIEPIQKRLRYLNKRQRQIERIESAVQAEQPINDEQKETLKSKAAIAASIKELNSLLENYNEIYKNEKRLKDIELKKEQKARQHAIQHAVQQSPPPQPTHDINDILKKIVTLIIVTNEFDDSSEGVALRTKFIQNEKVSIKNVEDFDTICNFKDTVFELKPNATRDHILEQSLQHLHKFITNSTDGIFGTTTYANLLQQVDEIWGSFDIHELFAPSKIETTTQPMATISYTLPPAAVTTAPPVASAPAPVQAADLVINFIQDSTVLPEPLETQDQGNNNQVQGENESDNKGRKQYYKRNNRGNRFNNNRNRNFNNAGDGAPAANNDNAPQQEDEQDNFQGNRGGYKPRRNYNYNNNDNNNNNNNYRRQNQNGNYYNNNNNNYRQNYNRQKFNTQPQETQTQQPTS